MRHSTRAGLAFKLGTNAARGPRPVISMRCAGEHGARRRANVSPIGASSVERRLTYDVSVRMRDVSWHHLSGGFRISFFQVVAIFSRGRRRTNAFNKGLGFNTL